MCPASHAPPYQCRPRQRRDSTVKSGDAGVAVVAETIRDAMRRWRSAVGARPRAIADLLIAVGEACTKPVTSNPQRAPQFRANPALRGTRRYSKSTRMAADVHLLVLTVITRHYAALGAANFNLRASTRTNPPPIVSAEEDMCVVVEVRRTHTCSDH